MLVSKEEIEKYFNVYKSLCGSKSKEHIGKVNEATIKEIHIVLDTILEYPDVFAKAKRIAKYISSYGMKHTLEQFNTTYISNTSLICAMLILGYDYKMIDSINMSFNIGRNYQDLLKKYKVEKKFRHALDYIIGTETQRGYFPELL